MAAWSTLLRSASRNFAKTRLLTPAFIVQNAAIHPTQLRVMSHNMVITPTRWQWDKTKDLIHFYFMVMAIPLGIITFCANVFVGPATLTEIPEGYEPKYWEYYKNPIQRFLARYFYNNPQKEYEKGMAYVYNEQEVIKVRKLEHKISELMQKRLDYQYNYFLPYNTFPTREFREIVKRDTDDMA
ncbi:NADH dehydrogenase [ubiquinone] 1 beta subcomplex subunit 5, mitochondrial [Phymastichus coffea]|uniref:NADH dehydrogenase [ubiquinone] 1 beta subcomplex subunit 5, mitochondrial n=1 Tax=Phymastichus coffea TaxID=108790 RepID=UPI00273CAAFA|nr:NADH dehydrogenase [ubiquinone] 1 beta subcomplex subunit 5, mitochondrial [Phymastichus coffea]